MTSNANHEHHGKTAGPALAALAAVLLLPGTAVGQDLASHAGGAWSIAAAPGMDRWIVVHDPAASQATGVYHVEVIGRKTGDPSWQVVRLVPHMAITERALLDSVIEPLQSGAVYPEPFNDAYAAWRAQNGGAGGKVCRTAVVECMTDDGSEAK